MVLSDEEYNFVFSKCIRLCVDLLVFNKDGFLVGKRSHEPFMNQYAFPGGRMMIGETIQETAQRVAKKELGVGIKAFGGTHGYMEFPEELENHNRHSVSIPILCSLDAEPQLIESSFTDLTYHKLIPKDQIIKKHLKLIKEQFGLIS